MTQKISQQNKSDIPKSKLSSFIFKRIEKEHVVPSPKWKFVFNEYIIWILWATSIIVGAVAISVIIFISRYVSFSMYEATYETPLLFFIEVLPYVWIFIFVFMVALAYINIRKTKKGYKYFFWQIIISSLLFSLLGGLFLHFVGVGSFIDKQIGNRTPIYPSLEEAEVRMWQDPDDGRMIGRILSGESDEDEVTVQFTDMKGKEWTLNIQDLTPPDLEVLYSGNKVRVLGILASSTDNHFHGCGVFPWMFDKNINLSDMQKERNEFIKRMYKHKSQTNQWQTTTQTEIFVIGDNKKSLEEDVCAKHATVLRIKEELDGN